VHSEPRSGPIRQIPSKTHGQSGGESGTTAAGLTHILTVWREPETLL
jgi:hypothetical protein